MKHFEIPNCSTCGYITVVEDKEIRLKKCKDYISLESVIAEFWDCGEKFHSDIFRGCKEYHANTFVTPNKYLSYYM